MTSTSTRHHNQAIVGTVAIALLLTAAGSAEATDYYVSAAGSDANVGQSPATAWRTIQRVNNQQFQAGDRILFEAGRAFSGSLYFDSAEAGTAAAPIAVGSYGTGRATIDAANGTGILLYNTAGYRITDLNVVGSGRDTNSGFGILVYADLPGDVKLEHIRVERVDATRFGEGGIVIGSWAGQTGYRDVRLSRIVAAENGKQGIFTYAALPKVHESVYVGYSKAFLNAGFSGLADNTGNGITLSSVNGGTVERSVAHDNGWRCTAGNGPIGIWAYSSTRVVIQFNESYNNKTGGTRDGGGFGLDINTSNSVLQYNYSHGNMGAGFQLAHRFDNLLHTGNIVRYNISENDGRKNAYASIQVWGRIRNAEVYNNTIYVASTPSGTPGLPRALYVENSSIPTLDVYRLHFRNNIVVTNGPRAVDVTGDQLNGAVDLRFENNLYFGSGTAPRFYWGGTTYSGLSAWRTATGQERVGTSNVGVETDPLLASPGAGVTIGDATLLHRLEAYRLRSGSPAIDSALGLALSFGINPGTRDYYGASVPQWSAFDIGAHEFSVECTWTINPAGAAIAAAGGSGSVQVSVTPSSCGWTATSHADWLTVSGGASGSGNGTVTWQAAQNSSSTSRSGSITIATHTFTVQQASSGSAPTAAITAPSNGATFAAGTTITVAAIAADADGVVSRVDFLVNGTVAGSDTSAPYTFAWTPSTAGSYTLAAVAVDNSGLVGRSSNVAVTVGSGSGTTPPPGWNSLDIGAVGVTGRSSYNAGTYSLSGSGADIWGAADSFRFAYRSLQGDGSIVARAASLENTHAWAKSGVMIRETLSAGSRHASMFVTPGKGLAFQHRTSTNGTSTSTPGPLAAAPKWLRIMRAGSTFTSAWSNDGAAWTTVGSATISMASSVYVGLAVTSHDNTTSADAVLDRVAVVSAWTSQDIGSVVLTGSASESGSVFRVAGAGADIWGSSDAFHFLFRRASGDGQIIARVVSLTNTHEWAKAGVMVREAATAGSRHAAMIVSGSRGLAFLRRTATAGTSYSTAGTLSPAPMWVKLIRAGSTFSAYQSADGVSWTLVGSATVAMAADALWGLAVTSHTTSALATGGFDYVTIVD